MTPSEAARQYQLAYEHERRLKHECQDVFSATGELAAAADETALARQQFIDVLVASELRDLEEL